LVGVVGVTAAWGKYSIKKSNIHCNSEWNADEGQRSEDAADILSGPTLFHHVHGQNNVHLSGKPDQQGQPKVNACGKRCPWIFLPSRDGESKPDGVEKQGWELRENAGEDGGKVFHFLSCKEIWVLSFIVDSSTDGAGFSISA